MIKATNVQYQNFNRHFEVVKCLKKKETCSKQNKVARNPKSCSKALELLEIRKVTQKWPSNLWTALSLDSNINAKKIAPSASTFALVMRVVKRKYCSCVLVLKRQNSTYCASNEASLSNKNIGREKFHHVQPCYKLWINQQATFVFLNWTIILYKPAAQVGKS